MDAIMKARLNAKYGKFYLVRWSPVSQRFVNVGKPRRTIEEAGTAAIALDKRNKSKGFMTFVETRPAA